MEITWLGHSSLRIRSNDTALITDPYADSLGISMGQPSADIVTISNEHPHHSNSDAVEGDPRVLMGPGEYEVANFYISGMGTPATSSEEDRSTNTVFTMHVEGLTMCHLGDLSRPLSARQVEELGSIDVLCIPVGGFCTIDVGVAAELVNLVRPRIVIPIHYRDDGVNVELEPVEDFLAHMGVSDAAPQRRLNVTSTDLPRERRVVALQRRA